MKGWGVRHFCEPAYREVEVIVVNRRSSMALVGTSASVRRSIRRGY
jgi:hypothetical protein